MNTLLKSRCLMLVGITVLTLLHLVSFLITGPVSGRILFWFSVVLFSASIIVPKYNLVMNFIILNFLCTFSESLVTKVILMAFIIYVVYRYNSFNYIDNDKSLSIALGIFLIGMFVSLYNITLIFHDPFWGIVNIFLLIGLCIVYTQLWKEAISKDPPKKFKEYY